MRSIIKTFVLKPIKQLLEKTFGLEIYGAGKHFTKKDNILHQRFTPLATYSPWEKDTAFKNVYKVAKDYSLVDKYKM